MCDSTINQKQTSLRLVSARNRTYLLSMKTGIRLFLVLLALALIGAPFGMGRMMDHAHQTMAAMDHSQMGHMQHGDTPAHKSSAPHFMMCAACFAVSTGYSLPSERIELREIVIALPSAILHGNSMLPDLPPPRV